MTSLSNSTAADDADARDLLAVLAFDDLDVRSGLSPRGDGDAVGVAGRRRNGTDTLSLSSYSPDGQAAGDSFASASAVSVFQVPSMTSSLASMVSVDCVSAISDSLASPYDMDSSSESASAASSAE